MGEDGEQERSEERTDASRPVTAAARRERRASARPSGKARGEAERPSGKARVAKSATEDSAGKASTPKKGKATRTRDRKEKRPSLFARFARFLREVVGELRKVIWPTRKQLVTYTLVVLVFVSFMVALVAGLDILFAKGVFLLFG